MRWIVSIFMLLQAVICAEAQEAPLFSDTTSVNSIREGRWSLGATVSFGMSGMTMDSEFFRPRFAYQAGLCVNHAFTDNLSASAGISFMSNDALWPDIPHVRVDSIGNVTLDSTQQGTLTKETVAIPLLFNYRFVTLSKARGISFIVTGGPVFNYTVRQVNTARFYLSDGTFLRMHEQKAELGMASRFSLGMSLGLGLSVRISKSISCIITPTYYRELFHPGNYGYDSFNGTVTILHTFGAK